MKYIYIKGLLLTLLIGFASCNDEGMERAIVNGPYTYPMYLQGGYRTFDDEVSTRAPYVWKEGDVVYLNFQLGSKRVIGQAVYNFDANLWTVTTSKALAANEEGVCTAVFICNPASVSYTQVQLSQHSVVYRDEHSSYTMQDGELTVTGLLTPQTGRIQFRGKAESSFTISGLSFLTTYNIDRDSFTQVPSKFTATTLIDGRTPYYYSTFANETKHELTFTLDPTVAFRRSFSSVVLDKGKSGYITIPTMDSCEGWTLIDPNTSAELSLPSLSDIAIVSVHSKSAKFSASVIHTGNTSLTAVGFVVSHNPNPTLSDTHVVCTTATSFSGSVTNLLPQTIYYIRAYASNALGTTYSVQFSFTTLSEEEEDKESIGRNDFESDVDWNNVQHTKADVKHEVFGEDVEWN